MKYLKAIVPVIALLVFAGSTLAQSNDKNAEREVRALERAWLDAYEKHDPKAMADIVGDEFVIVFPNGQKQNKQQVVDMVKQPARPGSGMKHRTEDVKAEVNGDKVILRGRVISETLRDGKVVSTDVSLYEDVYVKRNGRWQVIDSKLTDPPKKGT